MHEHQLEETAEPWYGVIDPRIPKAAAGAVMWRDGRRRHGAQYSRAVTRRLRRTVGSYVDDEGVGQRATGCNDAARSDDPGCDSRVAIAVHGEREHGGIEVLPRDNRAWLLLMLRVHDDRFEWIRMIHQHRARTQNENVSTERRERDVMRRLEAAVHGHVGIERRTEGASGGWLYADDVGAGQEIREAIVAGRIRFAGRKDVPVARATAPDADRRVGDRARWSRAGVVHDRACDTARRRTVDRANRRKEIECAVTQLVVDEAASHVEIDDDDGARA